MLENGTYLADRYEVLDKVGAGGMSDVYKAMDHSLGREVAIKVLKQEYAADSGFVSKFRQEAQAAAGLEHPNIVNIYDVGAENGMYYIVMEYVEGITLKTYISKKGQLTYNEVISIAIQVGRGIEAAHKKEIVHRDIKPQNIIISKEGKVKVTDFGIARAATANTINADIMGSVHYSSPEQARNGYVTYHSDIYSLGIVMYEMCTGRVPFDGDTTVAIALQHLQGEMVPPSKYAPELPISVEKIILKATMKNQDRRYASMEDMLNDLKRALVNPEEDFVNIPDSDEAEKTRVITDAEVKKIQEQAGLISTDEPAKPAKKTAPAKKKAEPEPILDDEDDEGLINPKMDKAIRIMGIAAAVVIVVLVIYLVGSFFGLFHFGKKPADGNEDETQTEEEVKPEEAGISMPDLLGMTEDEAKLTLRDLGLGYHKKGEASSDDYEEGQIIEQSVAAGSSVDKNTTIEVTLSSGKGEIEVPTITGQDEATAKSTLNAAGFQVNVTYEYNSEVEQGKVISQTPEGASMGKEGDTVTVLVSQGVESVKVPTLTGKNQDDATAALTEVGLTLGNVTSEYSDSVEEGLIISQGAAAGSYVDIGSSVSVVISKGAESVYYKYTWDVDLGDYDVAYAVLTDALGVEQYKGSVDDGDTCSASGMTTETGTLTYYVDSSREEEISSASVKFKKQ